ncbi:MAG: DUF4838 domain-containing protein [Oligosphaeraceae bacterium]|nr:DUF4838 domain-containing protein [Oligosphaeraceae bacterium]
MPDCPGGGSARVVQPQNNKNLERMMAVKFLRGALAVLAVLAWTTGCAGVRRIEVSGTSTAVPGFEIVLPEKTPLLEYAASELQTCIGQATGQQVPIVAAPGGGSALSLVLGRNRFLEAAGLRVEDLPREGYYIRRIGNLVFLAGQDSDTQVPLTTWGQRYQRGTLSATYDFLERFLGARFYFPGECGTVVPPVGELRLPAKIDIIEAPDLAMRQYYNGGNCEFYDAGQMKAATINNLNLVRLRLEETNVPFCHGTAYLNLSQRFAKTKPEFFALMPDGTRFSAEVLNQKHAEQLCFSSPGLRDVIAADAIAYLSAKNADERKAAAVARGLTHWSGSVANPGYFCVMPNDWLYMCNCEQCLAATGFGARNYPSDPASMLRASNHIWGFTADIARRVQQAGVPGMITQMAYTPYKAIPSIDLPDNIVVQVAVKGMTSTGDNSEEDALLAGWKKKTSQPVALWTYPGKHMQKATLKGIPVMIPKAVGKYIADRADLIFGTFLESETDYFLFNYLVYYVFAKVSWDTGTDIDALLDEHYRLMFAEAAPLFQEMFEQMEDLWLNRILGHTVDTPLGPVTKLPNSVELWGKIYSPALLESFLSRLDQAEKLTAANPAALKRVRFMREKLFGPVFSHALKHQAEQEAFDSWNVTLPGEVHLRPFKGEVCEVNTVAGISRTADSLIVEFNCEEPLLDKMILKATERDAAVFTDSCVEVLLNPSGDRKTYYQFIVNANGVLFDSHYQTPSHGQKSWNSQAVVQTGRGENSWSAKITIPLSDLGTLAEGGFPANFGRNRALEAAVSETYYQWSPAGGRSFHEISQWGTLFTSAPPNRNLLRDWNFAGVTQKGSQLGAWAAWRSGKAEDGQEVSLDERVFISGGKSLHFRNREGFRINAGQRFTGLEPSCTYRLSYFFRCCDLSGASKKGDLGAGAYFSFGGQSPMAMAIPSQHILGSQDWVRIVQEFKTGEGVTPETQATIGLWIWNAAGEAWFDHVILEKIQPE